MIALRGRATHAHLQTALSRNVWLLTDGQSGRSRPGACARLLDHGESVSDGYELYVAAPGVGVERPPANLIELPPELAYLRAGDIVSLSDDGQGIHVLWRHDSHQNSVLLTERCDHYCLMCSQPPRRVDDDWLLEQAFELIRLLPPDTREIGFTGGEPTLYGRRLLDLLRLCRNLIPNAGVHLLSNGRRFSDPDFAAGWAAVDNPNMMVGIPIYGAEPSTHDYVVQAHGAFDETIRGILNLGALNQRVEIRVVIHKQTAPHLPEIAEFIARNLPFVDQVALMGLEMIGLARANIDTVWIDPVDYQEELIEAVRLLEHAGPKTMIYNHQLCLLDRQLWPFAVRSISDWKNEYHPECLNCAVRNECGGFFFSAKYKMSEHIRAIPTDEAPRGFALIADGGSHDKG
jgi:His-Xaa-Ser system radical SAM maturase HxsC